MIRHSTLTRALLKYSDRTLTHENVLDLCVLTSPGVLPEGAITPDSQEPTMNVKAMLHSDLAQRLLTVATMLPPTSAAAKLIQITLSQTQNGVAPISVGSVFGHDVRLEVAADTHGYAPTPITHVLPTTPAAPAVSAFKLGTKSQNELRGVKTELVAVANRAIQLTTQDFGIFDGLRTPEEQAKYVASGVSKTLNSMHLKQADGFSHAMDCVPWINGAFKWDWFAIYKVVLAVDAAATELGVAQNIVWGGAWDRRLSDFGGSAEAYESEVKAYAQRHAGSDFLDGPHFEWRA